MPQRREPSRLRRGPIPVRARGAGPDIRLLAPSLALTVLIALPLASQEPSDVREEIEVARVVIDVRVVDQDAVPILGLGLEDFEVRVSGDPVRVESVDWIVGANASLDNLPADEVRQLEQDREARFPSRLIVMFFQRHTLPSRIVGLMNILKRADEFIETLGPNDRVAILTFDTHLRLFSDFSNDHEQLRDLIRRRIVPYRPPPLPEGGPFPSLARYFDHDAARRAATPEEALLVTAKALGPLKGSKTMLFFGWGLGEMIGGIVQMRPEYGPARRALLDARVSVFPLDVTRADYHSLEGPLIRVARDTGGYYIKTYYSSYFAMDSVAGIITGRYEVVFEKPDLPPDQHLIRARLTEATRARLRKGKRKPLLFFREFYDDRSTLPRGDEPSVH